MGSFIVFFDGQFWVGLVTRTRDDGGEIARVLFGPEPSDAALVMFAHDAFRTLDFIPTSHAPEPEPTPGNPKRRQREARRALEEPKTRTKAQQAMSAALDTKKEEATAKRASERKAEADARFALRQAKKKKKLRGK
ncbi:MAG: YjdF family protein [Polyangiaceae bacterium]